MTPMKTSLILASLLMLAACSKGDTAPETGAGDASPEASLPGDTEAAAEAAMAEEPAAMAEKGDGTLTATINGEERTWYTTHSETGGTFTSQSDWSGVAPFLSVHIMGHGSPDTTLDTNGALSLGFRLKDTGSLPGIQDAELALMTDSFQDRYTAQKGGSVNVSVDSATFDGNWLHLEGRFSGTLGFEGEGAPDGAEKVKVEGGRFDVHIHELR